MAIAEAIPQELTDVLDELRKQVASLTERLAKLEQPVAAPVASAAPESRAAVPQPVSREAITEEEILAISAAVAAFLGVHAHIRQVRLISSRGWAQEGRVTIQASHRLHS